MLSVTLPSDVLVSMHSEVHASEIVLKATESLQLDETELKEPTPETVTKIRCLSRVMKRENRSDCVKYLRTIVPSGTTGTVNHCTRH